MLAGSWEHRSRAERTGLLLPGWVLTQTPCLRAGVPPLQTHLCWPGTPCMLPCKVRPGELDCTLDGLHCLKQCVWLSWKHEKHWGGPWKLIKILVLVWLQLQLTLGGEWSQHFSSFQCKIKWVKLNYLLSNRVCRHQRAGKTEMQANVCLSSVVIHNL